MQKNDELLHELKIDGKSAHEYAKDDDEPAIAKLLLKKPDCSDLESSQPLRL
ncbi:hypothetical protein FHW67_003516 [Herbaspirillum sp. Sphag1AN]|nr:hypothetical protein [Herbaspirillum sp. Sphag1AN]MBB3247244.1 hypothetical protein [Herbaspirillum sp. Sphag64]